MRAFNPILRNLICLLWKKKLDIFPVDLGLWFLKDSHMDFISYTDADFTGCKIYRKSNSRSCYFLGSSLVSWSSKKQNSMALSTTKVEYIVAENCCAQVLWMIQTLWDFGLEFTKVPVFCDNTSVINLSKNHIQYSWTKHIEIRYHFLRDHLQKGDISLEFVSTEDQLADIFTKPLDATWFCNFRRNLSFVHLSVLNI